MKWTEKKRYFECFVKKLPAIPGFGDEFRCSSVSDDDWEECFYEAPLLKQSNAQGKEICLRLEEAACTERSVRIYFDGNRELWQVLDSKSMDELQAATSMLGQALENAARWDSSSFASHKGVSPASPGR